ncbi:MAG: polysaccharide biosynthesis tyrosine autokinase [Actinomycetota bacterium]
MNQYEGKIEERPADLRDYLAVLHRRRWTLLSTVGLVVVATLAFSVRETPMYQSEAELLVKQTTVTSTNAPPVLLNLETEKELAESESVAAMVGRRLDESPQELLAGLSVVVTTDTEILTFRYDDPDPVVAQRRAQAFAEAYIDFRRREVLDDLLAVSESVQQRTQKLNNRLDDINEQMEQTTDETERAALEASANSLIGQIALLQQELADLSPPDNLRVGRILGRADLPSSPVSPNYMRNVLLALVMGVALGIALAFLREHLDDSIRGRDDIEVITGAPVLAGVPRIAGWKKRDRVLVSALSEPKSTAAEAYRTLRTGLMFSAGQRDAKVLMTTSPHAGDGKTVTVANTGVVLAQAGKKVIVVSADLRKPRLHRFMGVENHTGLTNVLSGEVSPWQAVRGTEVENLQILVSGPVPGNPAELLGSDAMGRLVEALAEVSDYVLLDAAPVLAVADAATLAPLADGVLLVVDAEKTHRGALEQTTRQLGQVRADIIGSVYNNFDPSKSGTQPYYYRYSYRYEEPKESQEPAKTGRFGRRSASKG